MPFLIALGVAVALVPLAGRIADRFGLVDRAGSPLKIHGRPVPVLGGVAVYGSVFAALAVAERSPSWPIVAAAGLALGVGLVDDVRPLPAWTQAAAAAGAGGVLAAGGERLEAFGSFGAAATIVLALVCAVGVNLVDGQDGLAGGLAAIAALGLVGLSSGAGTALALALAGGLAGFLVWNLPPARIFLGSNGAYATGVLLAGVVAEGHDASNAPDTLASAACLGILALELGFTLVRRIRSGRRVLTADRRHTYDVLAARTGGRTASTYVLYAAAIGAAGLGHLIAAMPLAAAGALAGTAAALAAVTGVRLGFLGPAPTHGIVNVATAIATRPRTEPGRAR